ncbi:MAG: hypothetical protein PHU05_04015 [Bacilli bacterium]|nr:hypothetical protein [Bacilli bacterium]
MQGTIKQLIPQMLELDEEKIYEVKEHKKKRTLNQNSYYWEMLNKLAKKMRIPSEELHFELIKKSCPFEEYLVPEESNLRALEYHEVRNTIEKNGKLFKVVRVYVGSSLLDTTEMGILLDNLIEECKLQNIETMTPEELAKMRSLEESRKK